MRAGRGGHEPVREREDLGRRSVVLDERDDPRARMGRFEPEEVRGSGARERVDRLVGIPDDGEVLRLAEPEVHEPLRKRVRVLVLVDREPGLARPNKVARRLVGLEQVDRLDEHVLEVDDPGSGLHPLVIAVEPTEEVGRDRRLLAAIGDPAIGPDPADLRPFDRLGDVLHLREPIAAGQLAHKRVQQAALVVDGRRHRRALVAARPEVAELRQRHRVEGLGHDPGVPERGHSLDHLGRRLVGEGHEQDLLGLDCARLDRVRRAMADDPCLARPRPGDDRQGPGRDPNRLTLGIVQAVEESLRVARGRRGHR